MTRTIAVYGAYGHTGRFVVAELHNRGISAIVMGRDEAKLHELALRHPGTTARPASLDDPAELDASLRDVAAVINCAGPFASTARPIIEAALQAGIHYLDVAAEIEANLDTFADYGERARTAGITIIPAMAFFGGLGDLLATAAMGEWRSVDEISIAYGLDSWHPTSGTRASGKVSRQRRNGLRVVYSDGRLEYRDGSAAATNWTFPEPLGKQRVMAEFTMADSVTIPRHIQTPELKSYMAMVAVDDVANPETPPPTASDDRNRSSQRFVVDVVARLEGETRRATASGRDIYAVSAPLVVEAAERVINRKGPKPGVFSAGEYFDARDFLESLSPEHLILS